MWTSFSLNLYRNHLCNGRTLRFLFPQRDFHYQQRDMAEIERQTFTCTYAWKRRKKVNERYFRWKKRRRANVIVRRVCHHNSSMHMSVPHAHKWQQTLSHMCQVCRLRKMNPPPKVNGQSVIGKNQKCDKKAVAIAIVSWQFNFIECIRYKFNVICHYHWTHHKWDEMQFCELYKSDDDDDIVAVAVAIPNPPDAAVSLSPIRYSYSIVPHGSYPFFSSI